MRHYRLYFLSRNSGHIDRFEEFRASSDRKAVAEAEKRRMDCPIELWCGHQKIKRWDNSSDD